MNKKISKKAEDKKSRSRSKSTNNKKQAEVKQEPKKVQRKQSKGKQIQSKNTEQKSDQKITKPKISKVVSKVDLNAKATKAAPVKKRDSKLQDKVKIGKAKDGKTIEERVIDLKKIDKQIDAQLKKQKGKQAKVKEVKAKAKQVKPKVVKTQPKADNYGKADFVSDFEDDLSEEVIPKKRGAGGKIQNRAGQDKGSKPCIPKKTNKRKKVEIPEEYTKVLQNPDDLLIEDLEQDVFDNSPELKSLDCCVQCANTNVIRAAATQNHDLMKKCIDAKQHISSLLIAQSPEFKWTPLEYAISNGDKQTFDMLMNYQQHRSRRVNLGQTQLKEFDTGSVSNQAYGVEIRKVNMSRGNKLGNNAFLQETVVEENGFQEYLQNEYFIERMVLMEKLDYEFIQKIIKLDVSMKTFVNNTLIQKLLINNKVEIVEKLIAPVVNDPLFQVNQLLYATLVAQDLNQLPKNYNKLSVNKTSVFGGISSLHSAALNPNLEILKRLLVMIKSNDNLSRQKDDEGNECIHYAAACSSTGPLELLLARNFNVNSENNNKQTPIFIAVKCKQIQNIKIIMEEDETAIYYKDKSGNYPIHVAAKAGSIECLKALCKIEKDYINIQNGFHHLSPLMHAASYGRLEAVEFMVDKLKADINQVDKHDRNALLYAVRNGHTRIARFLITRGAYFNYPDDSLNYPFHYACAYGWLDCIKLLIRAGASISNANEWGFTPLIIAMMKGHKKIVDFLLDIDGIDVNSTDDKGRNLLCFSMMKFEEKTTDYVKHLIEQKGANPNQEDINKLTPFYYLLHAPYYSHKKSIKDYTTNRYQDKVITMQKSYYKLVEYLITVQGCDIQQFAKLNQSPLDMILQQNKLFLLPLFNLKLNINQNPDLMFKMTPKNDDNDNEVFIDFLNKHEKIDENILNGCNSQGKPYFFNYLKIKRYLYLFEIAKQDQDLQEVAIPAQDYFMDLAKNQSENLSLNLIQLSSDQQSIYSLVGDTKAKEKIQQYFQAQNQKASQLGLCKTEDYYVIQAQDYLYDKMVLDRYIKFLQIYIKMGACVNQYYIYPTYLALHPKFRDQMLTFYRLTAEENKEFQQLARRDYDAYKNKQPLAYEPEAIQPSQLIPIIPNSIFSNYSFNTATQITITPAQQFYNNLAYLNLYGLMSFMNSFKSMKLLKILVKEGLDINQKTLAGQTFFIELVSTIPNDDIQFTEYFEFLEQHNLDKSVTDQQGNNALLLSFQQNKIKIAEYLLTKNMDINATNKQIETLLILTVKKNDFDMAEYLLDKGSDPNIQDKMGRTALHYAVNNSSSTIDANFDMENLLISNNANVNLQDRTKRTPLHYAFVKIGQQSNQNQAMDPIETISSLCSVKDANPSIQDKYGKNVLHYAAQRGATISTLYLEKKGVDFHQKDAYGNTPLATAMLYNQVQYAIMLIKQGSNVNELVYPENRQAYLEYKKKIRESQMIDEDPDVSEPEAPVYNQNSIFGQQQYSLFGQQQYGYGQQQIFNAKQLSQPENMFKLAVQYQQLGLSYLILDYGFDLIMAMEDALKQQKFSLALTLLQKVSDNKAIQKSNQKNQNLFHILAINAKILNGMQNSKQLNRIYKQFKRREIDIAQKDILGRLPIHYAAINGAYSLLEIMLADACVQVDEVDSLGQTPLVLAIKGKNLRVNDNYHCFKILMNSQKVRQNIIYEEKYYDESNFQIYVPETLKVTPFNHLTRSIKFLEQNLAVSYLELFFASSSNLFDVFDQRDEQNRDPIMVLAQQNDYNCFKLIFKQIKVNMSKILPRYQGTIEPLPNKKEQTKNDLKKILENKDNQGKTSLQILITNCDSGTYDNYRFFLKLVSLGAEITSQNSDIKQIFDYQSKYPKSYIYRLIQKELKLNNLNKLPMLNINTQTNKKSEEKMIQLEDMMMIDTTQVDYLRDSERYLSELAQSQQIVIQKILPKPDKILGVDDKALTVEFENEDDIDSAYEANLIKIDLKKYGHSSRVYYKIQLLHDKVKNIYVVLTKWGMINAHDQGMCQKTPFQTKEKAVEEFLKIFKLKTSNNWADRENFQLPRAKGKYVYHKVSRQIFNYTDSLVPFIYKECAESQLEKDQQRFIKLIANIGMYSEVLKQKMINNNQLNLSNIKKEDILKGKDILEKIQELFKKAQVQYDEESTSENKYKEIVQLSSELYRTIPFCYSTELPEPICDQQQIDKFRNTLYDLLTLENSTKILMGAKYMSKQMSPLDYIYRSLGIDISYAEQDSLDYEIVKNYVVNTGQSYVNTYTINNIYKISRHQDEQNFQNNGFCNDPHRLLLFHGTGQQNLLSILSTGLKSSPLGVNQHGQAFGPGVYFSNMLDKSASYAVGTRYMELEDQEAYLADIDKDQPQYMERKYILICEVALGYILKQEQAQKTIIHSQYNYNYLQNYVANMAIGSQQQLREINQQVSKLKIVKVENNNQKKVDSDEDNEEVQDEDAKIEDEEVKAQKFDVNELSDEEQEGENEISKKRKLLGEKVNDTRTIRSRRMLEITNEKALPMFDTLWIGANQIPDPQFNLLLEDGSIIPQGRYVKVEQTVKKLEGQQYVKRIHQYTNAPAQSEFIVKNPERIKIRYIVELRSKTQAEKAKEVVQRTKINTDIIVE